MIQMQRSSYIYIVALLLGTVVTSCAGPSDKQSIQQIPDMTNEQKNTMPPTVKTTDTATFGAGCFWCVEAVFQQLEGVISVSSGYSGGSIKDPTYKEVCSGLTGHAEVCQIVFDPTKISYADLLQAFWMSHDPTTLNRQGNDVGTQYRSVIYYHDQHQKELAEQYKKQLDASHAYPDPVVTEISPIGPFYKAEDYHQNYFNENGDQPYCQFVVKPKVDKFRKVFKDKLKYKPAE
jgi:peptide-methionine (S)-S-oxide reductase